MNEKDKKKLISMYTTARQFKNAINKNEIFSIKNNKVINKIFPYIVNKSFACEVYLKLVIKYNNGEYKKTHSIKDLLEASNLQGDLEEYYMKKFNTRDLDFLNRAIDTISEAFIDWRYIYEQEDIKIQNGVLEVLCDYLDNYCLNVILKNLNIDINKLMYI